MGWWSWSGPTLGRGDITYMPTIAGFFYFSVVHDAWSRQVVGWSMATHLKNKLVLDTWTWHSISGNREVIRHSDQGRSTPSWPSASGTAKTDARPSMGSDSDVYDNALCESFCASLEYELIDRSTLRTLTQGLREIFDYVNG